MRVYADAHYQIVLHLQCKLLPLSHLSSFCSTNVEYGVRIKSFVLKCMSYKRSKSFFYLSIVGVSFLISPEISPKISSRGFPEFALFRISAGVPPGISSRKFSCVALRYPFKIIPNFLQQCLRNFPGNFIFF